MEKIFSWGILGCGNIARFFCENIQELSNAAIYAVASTSEIRVAEFQKLYGTKKAYLNYEELASDPNIDAIYVATPHSYHFEHTMLCLNNKKAVLCEKPFALDSKQSKIMIETAFTNSTFVMDAFWIGFHPAYLEAKRIVDSGELGKLKMIRADFGFHAPFDPENRLFNKSLGGGALMDVGVYPVFAALFFMGIPSEIRTVTSFGTTDVDEQMAILFQYDDGRIANLYTSFLVETPGDTDLYFEKGWLRIQRGVGYERYLFRCMEEGKMEKMHIESTKYAFTYQINEAMQCLRKGKIESQFMSHSFTQKFMETLDLIKFNANINYNMD